MKSPEWRGFGRSARIAPADRCTERSEDRAFVDRLNSLPSEKTIRARLHEQQQNEDIQSIHMAVRKACEGLRSQKMLDGFIVQKYDDEYGVHGFEYRSSL